MEAHEPFLASIPKCSPERDEDRNLPFSGSLLQPLMSVQLDESLQLFRGMKPL